MKLAVTLLLFVALPMVVFGIAGSSVSDPLETRRYEVIGVFLFGGENESQQRLHKHYRSALEAGLDEPVRRTFELAGIKFPDGTAAILNPADTHLYIRHHTSVLDTMELDFSITGLPYRPPSRLRYLLEDSLKRLGLFNDEPFAHLEFERARTRQRWEA